MQKKHFITSIMLIMLLLLELFTHCIKVLYTSAKATVTTNEHFNWTRQGCPLSPSLLALFIEPIAAAIIQWIAIKGFHTPNIEYKISLYTDSILLYLQDPLSSLKETCNLINTFSKISNCTINWTKSTILPLLQDAYDPEHPSVCPSIHPCTHTHYSQIPKLTHTHF